MRWLKNPRCFARTALRSMSLVLVCSLFGFGQASEAQESDAHHLVTVGPPPAFVASTAKSFVQLMDDAMAVMDYGMLTAPMNGEPDHDFVAMMIPHHQGAIDMAKALLLYTNDSALRNLAQGIITEQQNEIRLMQAWLKQHKDKPADVLKHSP